MRTSNQQKTVGKFVIIFIISLLAKTGMLGAVPVLRVLDRQGFPLKSAGFGQPFVLEVAVDGARQVEEPDIAGLDAFDKGSTSSYMSSINGRALVRYTYELIPKKIGTFTIGPAAVEVDGIMQASSTITLKVEELSEADQSSAGRKEPRVFMRLMTDVKRAYVGQKIACTLRFYYTNNDISLGNITASPCDYGRQTEAVGPTSGTQEIEGISYHYAEWTWDLYVHQPGEFVIPAYAADFTVRTAGRDRWAAFRSFFAQQMVAKRAYSNAIQIKIDPLPDHKKVDAVGSFSRCRAKIEPAVAKVGDAMVFSLAVTGDTDFDALKWETIQNLPAQLKAYPSKQSMEPSSPHGGNETKIFEFIVQGLQEGNFTIPAQELTYFDVRKRAYSTIKSTPLAVSLLPGAHHTKNDTNDTAHTPKQEEHEVSHDIDDQLALCESGPWQEKPSHSPLPWIVFVFLGALPVMPAGYRRLYAYGKNQIFNTGSYKKKYAFKNARKQLMTIAKERKKHLLQKLFITLIADRCMMNPSELLLDRIPILEKMSEQEQRAWHDFSNLLAQLAFMPHAPHDVAIFSSAQRWIDRLEELI